MPAAAAMNPTFIGYVGSTKDALLVIQAVLNGQLMAVPRRPHDKERSRLISSGSVFVFIEERSGIRRWTDGVAWSPSRILGRFLVYRELDRGALTGREGRGRGSRDDKSRRGQGPRKNSSDILQVPLDLGAPPASQNVGSFSSESSAGSNSQQVISAFGQTNGNLEPQTNTSNSGTSNRSLVGSLVASYAFKEYGLIKKTMSLTVNRMDPQTNQPVNETIHLVSYYAAEDVLQGKLARPVDTPTLKDVSLSNELWTAVKETSLGGKVPSEDESLYFMGSSSEAAATLGFGSSGLQSLTAQANDTPTLPPPPPPPHHTSDPLEAVPVSSHQQHHHPQQHQQQVPHSNYTTSSTGMPYGAPLGYSISNPGAGGQFAIPTRPGNNNNNGGNPLHHPHHQHQHSHSHSASFPLPPPAMHSNHTGSGSSESSGAAQVPPSTHHLQQHQQPFLNDMNLPMYSGPTRFSQGQNFGGFVPGYQGPVHEQVSIRGGSPDSPTRSVKNEIGPTGVHHGASNYNAVVYPSSMNQYPRVSTMDIGAQQHLVNYGNAGYPGPGPESSSHVGMSSQLPNNGAGGVGMPVHVPMGSNSMLTHNNGKSWINSNGFEDAPPQFSPPGHESQPGQGHGVLQHHGFVAGFPAQSGNGGNGGQFGGNMHGTH